MKNLNLIQLQLIQQLGDSQYHSKNSLGKHLNLESSIIWQQIKDLIYLGFPIQYLPKKGYQLTYPIILLNETKIKEQLEIRAYNKDISLHLFAVVPSTNLFLKQQQNSSILTLCCTEMQTHGRGRFQRSWFSPFGENIYYTMKWQTHCCPTKLSGLSLVVGLAVLKSIKESHIKADIQLKWPNDLIWKNKKLGGVLVEIISQNNNFAQIIIGVGINVNSSIQKLALINKPTCSLFEITSTYHDRNVLIANLTHTLTQYVEKFLKAGWEDFSYQWQQIDYLHNQFITVRQPQGVLKGIACGVNELGQLCLQDQHGKKHFLSSGDSSLNPNSNFT